MKHQTSDNSLASDSDLKVPSHIAILAPSPRPWYMPPEWVTKNLTTKRHLKVFFRCSVAVWASYIIMLPNTSSRALGTIGFFAILTSFFIPPYLPAQLFFFIMTTVMLGLLFGWGMGMAAMRAANSVRNENVILAGMKLIGELMAANPALPEELAAETIITQGVFLEIKPTAIYGCFLGVVSFVLAALKAYAPALTFMSIFGTIAFDIFATIGPMFPVRQYNLVTSMAVSTSCYFAIGLASTVFIFPETMNHAILNDISEQLDRIKALVLTQNDVLAMRCNDLHTEMAQLNERTKLARKVLVSSQTQLTATARFIHLEFSWGKWTGGDVLDLLAPLQSLVSRVAALQSFGSTLGLSQQTYDSEHEDLPHTPKATDTYLLRQVQGGQPGVESEHKVRISDILPILEEATHELRSACLGGIDAVTRSIDHVNKKRWGSHPDLDGTVRDELDNSTARLQEAIRAFKDEHRLELLRPFVPIVENNALRNALPLRSLFISYVFGTAMVSVSEATLKLMTMVGDTMQKRRSNRLWAPKGLRKIGKILQEKGDQNNGALGEDVSPHPPNGNTFSGEQEVDYRRNPDSKPPTNIYQWFMHGLSQTWRWFQTPEAIFCVKYVLVTIGLWIPSVCRSSANFYYEQKGIWAIIMAQTMVNMYSADHLYNYVTRMIGSVIGLVLGMLVWYCGTGKGDPGSPWGIAASSAVFIPILVFLRVYAPIKYIQGMVLAGATFSLVVGYSWVDGHLPQVSNPGLGWDVAWHRAMTVFVGCAAASVVMFLPPSSGRRAVRVRNGNSIASISRLYGTLMTVWVSDLKDPQMKQASMEMFKDKAMAASMEMTTIADMTDLAKWEGRVRGRWARSDYLKLIDLQVEMISSLVQLGGALTHMDDEWRVAFLSRTGVLNPNFIADVMTVFHIVAQSLRTAEPLHEVLPTSLTEKLFYHHAHSLNQSSAETLTIEHLQSLDYMYYASGVVAVVQLLHSLDEVQKISKGLCGEEPLKGYGRWKSEFQHSMSSGL